MGKDEELPSERTVQMSAEELARLHAQLEGKYGGREAADETSEVPAAEPDEPIAPLRQKPAPAPAPRRSTPAPAPAAGRAPGGGLLIVGGIGAILAGLGPGAIIPTFMQGMGREPTFIILGVSLMIVGHLLAGLGMFGAISRTGSVSALVGTLHMLSMGALTFFLLGLLRVIEFDGDLVKVAIMLAVAVPGTTWLLSAIWGFAAAGSLGTAMAVLHGIFGILGGGAFIGLAIGAMTQAFRRVDDDLAIALIFGGAGSILLAGIFLAVGMFGRLRSAPAR